MLRIVPAIVIFLSGGVVPLPLFPEWMHPFLASQPLRGLVDTPTRVYSGDLIGAEAFSAVAGTLLWVVVLVLIGRWALARGLEKLVIAGG